MKDELFECAGEENESSVSEDNGTRSEAVLAFIDYILMCCNVGITVGLLVAWFFSHNGVFSVSDTVLGALIVAIMGISCVGVVIKYFVWWKK